MKTYTDINEIRTAIKRLKGFTESRPKLPVLELVMLEASDGKLRLTVPNNQYGKVVSFTTASVLTNFVHFSVCVKYADLKKIIDKCKADVEFSVRDENALMIKSGRLEFTLNGKDPDHFPALPAPRDDREASSAISYNDMQAELAFVHAATDESTHNNYTSGVLFHFTDAVNGTRLRLIGTDGRRLHSTFTESRCHSVGQDKRQWLVPVQWVKAFNGLKLPDNDDVYVEFFGDDRMDWRIPTSGLSGTVSLLDCLYPEYPKVIPDDCTSRFRLDVPGTIETLNALSVVAKHKDGRHMVVVNANGRLDLSARSESMGNASGMVECSHLDGPDAAFALNVDYFTETLKLAGKREVVMANSGSLEPVRFDYQDTDRVAVVMPVRMPE